MMTEYFIFFISIIAAFLVGEYMANIRKLICPCCSCKFMPEECDDE